MLVFTLIPSNSTRRSPALISILLRSRVISITSSVVRNLQISSLKSSSSSVSGGGVNVQRKVSVLCPGKNLNVWVELLALITRKESAANLVLLTTDLESNFFSEWNRTDVRDVQYLGRLIPYICRLQGNVLDIKACTVFNCCLYRGPQAVFNPTENFDIFEVNCPL